MFFHLLTRQIHGFLQQSTPKPDRADIGRTATAPYPNDANEVSRRNMKTLGQYLDEPNEFFWWLNNSIASIVTLNAAIRSGLIDALGEEPVSVDRLSAECGIPTERLERLVRFLAAEEVVALLPDGNVSHTPRSRTLPSVRSALACSAMGFEAGVGLDEALRKGITSFEQRFGKPVFEHLGEHPEIAVVFASFMAYLTTLVEEFVFTHHDFRPFTVAVDVGGSHGGLLLNLLARHPAARGIVFDLPEVADMVTDQISSAEHGDRVDVVGGDFFESLPSADLYLLKMILHDWSDDECKAILRSIRAAIAPSGRVSVIEYVMPETPRPHPANAMDIAMLVWATGRERKLSEFNSLFDASGFRIDRVTENPRGQSVIEAIAA